MLEVDAVQVIKPKYVCFKNGVLDLLTGRFEKHSPRIKCLYRIEANYSIHAARMSAPHFDTYLNQITGGDSVLIERIWQMLGYVLAADRSAKGIFLLQGVSNSGKSVLANMIHELFSTDSRLSMDFHALAGRFNASELQNKFLYLSNDMPANPLPATAVAFLKQYSGNDAMSSEVKFEGRAHFYPTANLIMVSNHRIQLNAPDPAFRERIITIPFRYAIPRELQDASLRDYIREEYCTIVSRAMKAYWRLCEQNYVFAGDYPMNEVTELGDSSDEPVDLPSQISDFLVNNFEYSETGGMHTADIHRMFVESGGSVKLEVFSKNCIPCAEELFGCKKGRSRRPGGKNPLSFIECIKPKTSEPSEPTIEQD